MDTSLKKIGAGVASVLAAGVFGAANMNLEPSILDYPLLADKPIEKLEWVYHAQEILRLEHNEMGRQFREGIITEQQWNEYLEKSFDEKSKWLGYEASILRTELGYTGFEIMSTSTKEEAYRQEAEQKAFEKSTRWNTKTDEILVKNIAAAATEDFTTYTENDPNSKITVTASKIDIAALARPDSARVYKDMTSAHFSGNFEHLFEGYSGSATTDGGSWLAWAVANSTSILSNSTDTSIFVRWYQESGTDVRFYIGCAGGQAGVLSLNQNTVYYIKVKRNEAVGTFGTAYVYVYSDSGRTTLVGSNSIALVTALYDYQYIYGFANMGGAAGFFFTGYLQNLNLQETPAASPVVPNQTIIFE